MRIGLYDADGHNFPSLPLMKISAYHKAKGDSVEFAMPLTEYDRVYVSRVFGDEYTSFQDFAFNAKEIIYGGTGSFSVRVNSWIMYREKTVKASKSCILLNPQSTAPLLLIIIHTISYLLTACNFPSVRRGVEVKK